MGTPNHHPKSQPFVDHVLNFSIVDNKIWVRNFQISDDTENLAEVGPRLELWLNLKQHYSRFDLIFNFRFVLNIVKIFDGCFGGVTLYENPHYVAPAVNRRLVREKASMKYNSRISQKLSIESRKTNGNTFNVDPTDDVFKV